MTIVYSYVSAVQSSLLLTTSKIKPSPPSPTSDRYTSHHRPQHKRRYTNEQLASALRSLKPVSGPGRSLSTIRSSGSNLFGSADPDLHHFYSPRAVSDLFAEHHFLSKLFYPHKIPGCLRCCMTRSEGYETDPACGYPVVTIEEGGGWRIRVCGDLKREWDEEMGGVGVELEGEQ